MRNSAVRDRWRQDRGAPSWQRGWPARESTALLLWQWRANRGRKCLQPQRQSAPAQRRCTSTAWERMGSHRSPSSISQQLATIAAIVLLLLGTGICGYRRRLCRTYKGRLAALLNPRSKGALYKAYGAEWKWIKRALLDVSCIMPTAPRHHVRSAQGPENLRDES